MTHSHRSSDDEAHIDTRNADEKRTDIATHIDTERHRELVAFAEWRDVATHILRSGVTAQRHLTTEDKVGQIHLAGVFVTKVANELRRLDLDEQGCHRATGTPVDDYELNLVSLMIEAEREIGVSPTDEEIDRMPEADAKRATAERQRKRNFAYSTYLRIVERCR
ncbi:MAG: hypothetical protein EBX97_02490 [Actinobacteria bacterium]|jgi:hypothetical protein|nr:hypothetical protein [Actinomycetota bacterium]